jgi:hypothetical protein
MTKTDESNRNDADDPNSDTDEVGVGCLSGQFLEWGNVVTFAQYCPLLTAILAPLATLMDIPALTVSSPSGSLLTNSKGGISTTETLRMTPLLH